MEKGYYIIVRGPAASGKSTVSRKLAEHLNAHYIELDLVRAKYKLRSRKRDRIKANNIIIPEIKKHLDRGQIVVIDDVFYHREPLDHLIENLPYEHLVFTLKAPLELVFERNMGRQKVIPRKMVKDAWNKSMSFDHGIMIDNTMKFSRTLEKIISYIPRKLLKLARKSSD